jgi:5-methylcytosine-specific restriction endonuclease McrA
MHWQLGRPASPHARDGSHRRHFQMNASYAVYLESAHWKALRTRALKKAGGKCELCGHPHLLEVHHLMYRRLYDVTLDDLMTLCAACHSRAHSWITWGEIVNGETSEERRHVLIVRFNGEMNHRREIRRREEPKTHKRRETKPIIQKVAIPEYKNTSTMDVSHLFHHGGGIYTTPGMPTPD